MPANIDRWPISKKPYFLYNAAFVFAVVLIASLFGILTRPMGLLAAVWPANAVLMALMIRRQELARAECWLAALLGYLTADLMTGGEVYVTLWLTGANLTGVAVGYHLFKHLDSEDRQLRRPMSVVSMFCICGIAAATTGVTGSAASHILFGQDLLTGFAYWFTSDLVNSIIILPVILTAPEAGKLWNTLRNFEFRMRDWTPAATLVLATTGGFLVGGPGAFVYPMPALIWCALAYNLFTTSVVTMAFCLASLIATATGSIPSFPASNDTLITVSIRLGMAFLALAPLAVAIVDSARNDLLERLQHIVQHDALTGTLSRRAFLEMSEAKLAKGHSTRSVFLALMIDLDHFKAINDQYGHATGDFVLRHSTIAMSSALRSDDLFGRVGGEEFAAFCNVKSEDDITTVPERLRAAVETMRFPTPDGETIGVTVSIGAAVLATEPGNTGPLHHLLAAADDALYKAKAQGRNMVVLGKIANDRRHTQSALKLANAES